MNVLLLAQNYPPDLGAGAFRLQSLAQTLAEDGHHVSVLTGSMNRYGDCNTCGGSGTQEIPNLKVFRIPALKDNGSTIKRGIGYSLFFAKAFPKALWMARDCDIIFATTPQLLVGFLGAISARLTARPFILDIRDLWPDVMLEMGILSHRSIVYKTLKRIESFTYGQAKKITVNSPAFIDYVTEYCGKKPFLVTNGLDNLFFETLGQVEEPPKDPPYVITYAGNIGAAQDLMPVLRVAGSFKGKLVFRLIGNGSDKERLVSYAEEKGLDNVAFIPPLPREYLIKYYAGSHAFLVHLKNIPMFSKTIPSKIFEYVATGKPVVYGLSGVAREMMASFQGDLLAFTPCDIDGLKKALTNLIEIIEGRTPWSGISGIGKIKQDYLRKDLSKRLASIITEEGR